MAAAPEINWNLILAVRYHASMEGHVIIRIIGPHGGGEPVRTAYAVAVPGSNAAQPWMSRSM